MQKVDHKPTQNDRILNYMKQRGSITTMEAIVDIGVMRLASRISDMRREGIDIKSETVAVMNRYGEKCHVKRYSLGDAE